MSTLWSQTYDWPVAPTLADANTPDPGGPFAAVLITAVTPGTITIYPLGGPLAGMPQTIGVAPGQLLQFPIMRVGLTGTTVTALGLVSNAIVRQGGFTK